MMKKPALYKITLFAALVLLAQPAMAHPHIFAKYGVDMTQKDKSTLRLHFTFKIHNVATPNPLYRDQQPITANLIEALGEHPFYLFLDMDGHPLGQQNVALTRDGGTEDEPIFTFDMDVPADAGNFGFSIYDPEYYDSISLDGSDSLKIEANNIACSTSRQEVSKTMWGPNYATHVECGDNKKPLPNLNALKKNNRFDDHNSEFESPLNQKMILP